MNVEAFFDAQISVNTADIDTELSTALKQFDRKIVVLDDDPTGVQTVNNINVYTDWTVDSIADGFNEPQSMFFILTNSRSWTADRTRAEHRLIAERLLTMSRDVGKKFIVISRSDSTLRGHYPTETATLREVFEREGIAIDGEILLPFFKEGGRFTIGDVHYVREGDRLIPAASTEFARDKTFGYRHSNLREYVEEKTRGQFPARDVVSVTLEELRAVDIDGIATKLLGVTGFNKVLVNAVDYVDVKVFVLALLKAISAGKEFLFRTAAALPKVIGGVVERPLLTAGELVTSGNVNGGLIVIGSHVRRTTEQFELLRSLDGIECIEFDVGAVFDSFDGFNGFEDFDDLKAALLEEVRRVAVLTERVISSGRTAVVFTSRRLLTLPTEEASLKLSVMISRALAEVVSRLSIMPRFLIAKGGITSSDVGTIGLGVKRALVLGQVLPGIPVWHLGNESKFPGLNYIIFPGNVGAPDTLKNLITLLTS